LAAGAGQRRDDVARGSQALVAAAGTRTAAAAAAAAVGTRMAAAAGGAGAGRRGAGPTGGAAEGRGGWGGEGTGSGASGTIERSGGRREAAAAAPRRSRGSGAGRDTRPWRRRTRSMGAGSSAGSRFLEQGRRAVRRLPLPGAGGRGAGPSAGSWRLGQECSAGAQGTAAALGLAFRTVAAGFRVRLCRWALAAARLFGCPVLVGLRVERTVWAGLLAEIVTFFRVGVKRNPNLNLILFGSIWVHHRCICTCVR
jgi:hypothetical protein